ncbi:MAG TPA: 2-iminoacetate synthase ThiH [Candidatus Hydrogenedentes bacterium]|nr:2-iminoacetate synthase ThiH [Candidatus Hydrogenedentota bacterium]
MHFLDILESWPEPRIRNLYDSVSPADVRGALSRERRDVRDLVALLSPVAIPMLEDIARESQRLTRRQFGRTISLYAPIYLSNVCAASCVYCGFSANAAGQQERVTLSAAEIELECKTLSAMGYESVLLLTGDAPAVVPPEYIADACSIARRWFASVAVEVYAMDAKEYELLCAHGLDGMTLYMETYERGVYAQMHRHGRKRDYLYRLEAVERAAAAGARRISMGVLLGLYDWRIEMIWLALHARYLERKRWQTALSVSFPRLRHTPPGFQIPHPASDMDLAQMIVALRLFLPEAGFNLSTRESAQLRDRLLPLGITSMSAGSSTRPGGYGAPECNRLAQFEIEDQRSPAEVVAMIRRAGYDPVWKDFDDAFLE